MSGDRTHDTQSHQRTSVELDEHRIVKCIKQVTSRYPLAVLLFPLWGDVLAGILAASPADTHRLVRPPCYGLAASLGQAHTPRSLSAQNSRPQPVSVSHKTLPRTPSHHPFCPLASDLAYITISWTLDPDITWAFDDQPLLTPTRTITLHITQTFDYPNHLSM